jgi:hypothetical protein
VNQVNERIGARGVEKGWFDQQSMHGFAVKAAKIEILDRLTFDRLHDLAVYKSQLL